MDLYWLVFVGRGKCKREGDFQLFVKLADQVKMRVVVVVIILK